MDVGKKDTLKKIAFLFIMLALVNSMIIGFITQHENENKENEIIYNEMEVVYKEIVEEKGEYCLDALEYQQIMNLYKPFNVPILFIIFSFAGISIAVYLLWYAVVD